MMLTDEEFLRAAHGCERVPIQSPRLPPALYRAAASPGAIWRNTRENGRELIEPRPGMPPRRWAEIDRGGHLMAILQWEPRRPGEPDRSGLVRAALRSPGGRWAGLFPSSGDSQLWGRCDGIAVLPGGQVGPSGGHRRNLASLPSQDYENLRFIPPVDSPGALPPGAGTTLLNLFARLMLDQGVTSTRYKGPYPTPALFQSLCASFLPPQPEAEALAEFAGNGEATAFAREFRESPVAWEPEPFEGLRGDLNIDLRMKSGIDAAWLDDISFTRCPPQFPMPAGNRIWRESAENEPHDVLGLAALGRPMRRFARMKPDGSRITTCEDWHGSEPGFDMDRPFDEPLRVAAVNWAVVQSTPALAEATASLGNGFPLTWGAVPRALTYCTDRGITVHAGLGRHFMQAMKNNARIAGKNPQRKLALMFVSDLFGVLARDLAMAAQRRLAHVTPVPDPADLMARGLRCRQAAQEALGAVLPQLLAGLSEGRFIPD